MSDIVESLILGLLEWAANGERSYDQVMDTWRTSCPKLTVWEDANDRGLVTKVQAKGHLYVRITSSGLGARYSRLPSLWTVRGFDAAFRMLHYGRVTSPLCGKPEPC
jgi:trans-aconitate 2-methyltransferase